MNGLYDFLLAEATRRYLEADRAVASLEQQLIRSLAWGFAYHSSEDRKECGSGSGPSTVALRRALGATHVRGKRSQASSAGGTRDRASSAGGSRSQATSAGELGSQASSAGFPRRWPCGEAQNVHMIGILISPTISYPLSPPDRDGARVGLIQSLRSPAPGGAGPEGSGERDRYSLTLTLVITM